MKALALDLGRKSGWCGGDLDAVPEYGSFAILGDTWGEMAISLEQHVVALIDWVLPSVVAYEGVFVQHAKAAQALAVLAGHVEYICKKRDLLCFPVPNLEHKKNFTGRTFGKKEHPYPGVVECNRRGFAVDTTDEADAISIWYTVAMWIDEGRII